MLWNIIFREVLLCMGFVAKYTISVKSWYPCRCIHIVEHISNPSNEAHRRASPFYSWIRWGRNSKNYFFPFRIKPGISIYKEPTFHSIIKYLLLTFSCRLLTIVQLGKTLVCIDSGTNFEWSSLKNMQTRLKSKQKTLNRLIFR